MTIKHTRSDYPVNLLHVRLLVHSLAFRIEVIPMIARQFETGYIRPEKQEIHFPTLKVVFDYSRGNSVEFSVYCLAEDLDEAKELVIDRAKMRLEELEKSLASMRDVFDKGPEVTVSENYDLRHLDD